MPDSDKNIIITPNRGLSGQPEIYFGGSGGVPIRMKVLDDSFGTLSWEGSAGQLFSINNNLTSGSIFSVNDVSGIPSIDVNANGTVSIAGFTGNVGLGLTAPTAKLHVVGNGIFTTGVSASSIFTTGITTSTLSASSGCTFTGAVTFNGGVTLGVLSSLDVGGNARFAENVTLGNSSADVITIVGGATFSSTTDLAGVARFASGVTLASTLDVTGIARFNGGVTFNNTLTGLTATFNRLVTATQGVTASAVFVSGGSTFAGTVNFTNPVGLSAGNIRISSITPLGTNPLTIFSPLGNLVPPLAGSVRLYSDDGLGGVYYSTVTTETLGADRTITLPNETGTVALRGANTFTGLQSLTSGLSAAGGITLNGAVTGATATFNRLLSAVQGISAAGATFTGSIIQIEQGVQSGYPRIEWCGLTSSYDIIPSHWANMSAPINSSPVANDAYFAPIFITRRVRIKTIGFQTGTNGAANTGNILLGLYDSNSSGFPNSRLYTSTSIALSTGSFAVQRATSVDTIVNPGQHWLAIVFSASSLAVAGLGRAGTLMKWLTPTSSSPIGQASVDGLRIAQGSFTLLSSQSGTFTTVAGSDNPAIFYTAEAV